jgi:hypothetical protein
VAVLEVLLPVEEPVGHLEGLGVLHDGDDLLQLVLVQLTGPEYVSDSWSAMRSVWIHIDERPKVIAHAAPPRRTPQHPPPHSPSSPVSNSSTTQAMSQGPRGHKYNRLLI